MIKVLTEPKGSKSSLSSSFAAGFSAGLLVGADEPPFASSRAATLASNFLTRDVRSWEAEKPNIDKILTN
jgi:hypothetical protein